MISLIDQLNQQIVILIRVFFDILLYSLLVIFDGA